MVTVNEPLTLRFGGYQGTASVHHQAADVFGRALTERLGDRLTFEIEPDILSLGHKSGDLLPLVAAGTFDVCYMSTIRFSEQIPAFKLFEIPTFDNDRTRLLRLLDGALGRRLAALMTEHTPFRVLGFWDNGIRHVTNRVRRIRNPADCAGLTIRTQMTPTIAELFSLIGFNAVNLDIKTFLDGIETGAVHAQDNPLTSIRNFGIQHHHPHVTLTGHLQGITMLLARGSYLDGLPKDVRTAIDNAAQMATARQREIAAAEDDEVLADFATQPVEIVHLSDRERTAFRNAAQPLIAHLRADLPGDIAALLKS